MLVAATENKNLLIFDPHNHKLLHKTKAHSSCVNYVKFLDSRMFASCSDDSTIALWDIRNLNKKLKQLSGHTNWVKNIEYDNEKGLLVSSGYDGQIIVWDINEFTRVGRALQVNNLLRMRLTNDLTKMIISTNQGYIIVIHDLSLPTLQLDLRDFPMDLYNLMQKRYNCGINMGTWFNDLFVAKRNRIELISDFPSTNCGCISSLEVHPHDWCVASRHITKDESLEWTCVHNIQDDEKPSEFIAVKPATSSINSSIRSINQENFEFGENNPVIIVSNHANSSAPRTTFLKYSKDYKEIRDSNCKVYKNISRMRYFISEPNVNQGYIKEISFSPEGRVICSPYKLGYRILSFNSQCNEICDCVKNESQMMHVLTKTLPHPNFVVTTRFSPNQCQIASGCLGGRVIFSQPVL